VETIRKETNKHREGRAGKQGLQHKTGNTDPNSTPPLKDGFQTSQSVHHGWVEGSRRRGQGSGGWSPGGGPEDRNGELGDRDQAMRPGLHGTGHGKPELDGTGHGSRTVGGVGERRGDGTGRDSNGALGTRAGRDEDGTGGTGTGRDGDGTEGTRAGNRTPGTGTGTPGTGISGTRTGDRTPGTGTGTPGTGPNLDSNAATRACWRRGSSSTDQATAAGTVGGCQGRWLDGW